MKFIERFCVIINVGVTAIWRVDTLYRDTLYFSWNPKLLLYLLSPSALVKIRARRWWPQRAENLWERHLLSSAVFVLFWVFRLFSGFFFFFLHFWPPAALYRSANQLLSTKRLSRQAADVSQWCAAACLPVFPALQAWVLTVTTPPSGALNTGQYCSLLVFIPPSRSKCITMSRTGTNNNQQQLKSFNTIHHTGRNYINN